MGWFLPKIMGFIAVTISKEEQKERESKIDIYMLWNDADETWKH